MKTLFLVLSLLALHAHAKNCTSLNSTLKYVQDGMNKFAVELFKKIATKELGNFIISPFSVYMALATVSYGTQGKTEQELHQVLHLSNRTTAELEDVARSIAAINNKLQSLKLVTFYLGNEIFVDKNISINSPYRDMVETAFNSTVKKVNFGNPRDAARVINTWTNCSTAGKIREIVTADNLEHKKLVLINSPYFLGKWKVPFDPTKTWPFTFFGKGYGLKMILNMYTNGTFEVGELPEMNARFLVLPYQDGDNPEESTYMYIILPADLAKVEDKIDSLTLEDLQKTRNIEMVVLLPKFIIENTFKLGTHLNQLGVKTAFKASDDFNQMIDEHKNLRIGRIIQKTVIAVDEWQTGENTNFKNPLTNRKTKFPEEFLVNRPFLVIVATKDVILFTGKVVDPYPQIDFFYPYA